MISHGLMSRTTPCYGRSTPQWYTCCTIVFFLLSTLKVFEHNDSSLMNSVFVWLCCVLYTRDDQRWPLQHQCLDCPQPVQSHSKVSTLIQPESLRHEVLLICLAETVQQLCLASFLTRSTPLSPLPRRCTSKKGSMIPTGAGYWLCSIAACFNSVCVCVCVHLYVTGYLEWAH